MRRFIIYCCDTPREVANNVLNIRRIAMMTDVAEETLWSKGTIWQAVKNIYFRYLYTVF